MLAKLEEIDSLSHADFKKLSDKAVKFAKENLSIESFKDNVQKVLDSVKH